MQVLDGQKCSIPGDDLGQTVVVDEAIPVLLVVDVKLGVLPVIDDSAILSATVIFGNNFTPLFPKILFELKQLSYVIVNSHSCFKIQTLPF